MSREQASAIWWQGFKAGAAIVGLSLLIVGLIAGFCLGQSLKGPNGAFAIAAGDLVKNVPPDQRHDAVYLTVYNYEDPDREKLIALRWKVVNAVNREINSLSFRRIPILPTVVYEPLDVEVPAAVRLDLRALEWNAAGRKNRAYRLKQAGVDIGGFDAEIWDALAERDPYFKVTDPAYPRRRGWIDPKLEADVRLTQTQRSLFILRADWFLVQTGHDVDTTGLAGRIDGFYSRFLLLPDNEADLLKILVFDEKRIGRDSLATGDANDTRAVANHNRFLELLPSQYGAPDARFYWRTYDTDENVDNKSILKTTVGPDGFAQIDEAAGEVIFSLPNGLHGYYLKNSRREGRRRASEVPTNLAQRKGHPVDVVVYSPWTCVSCHTEGIKEINDGIRETLIGNRSGDVRLKTIGKLKDRDAVDEAARRVEDYFLAAAGDSVAALNETIEIQKKSYARAVRACNGLEPGVDAANYVGVIEDYHFGRVDLRIAAAEMGLGLREAWVTLKRSGVPEGLALVAGRTVGRDAWEDAFAGVMQARKYSWEARQ